jgi:16S rRNA (guanine966-N2)-methyltransferase
VARRGPGRLRVVAGRVGGRRLESLPGEATRPTTERVREAVYSSLGSDVVDASVLDLYAGTGALAIEALSRGAARAVLVDADRAAADLGRRNLAATGFADVARVVEGTAAGFLALPPPPEAPFALVTCDPPYATPDADIAAVLTALTAPGWLAPDATAVVERGVRTPVDPVPPGWRLRFARAYGDTLVTLLTAGQSDPAT